RLTESMLGRLADWFVIDVIQEGRTIRCLSAAHRNPEQDRVLRRRLVQRERSCNADDKLAEIARSGRAELHPGGLDQVTLARWFELDPLGPEDLLARSLLVVPLRGRQRTLGVLTLAREQASRHYDKTDQALAEQLAARIAVAIDNRQLYDRAQHA